MRSSIVTCVRCWRAARLAFCQQTFLYDPTLFYHHVGLFELLENGTCTRLSLVVLHGRSCIVARGEVGHPLPKTRHPTCQADVIYLLFTSHHFSFTISSFVIAILNYGCSHTHPAAPHYPGHYQHW